MKIFLDIYLQQDKNVDDVKERDDELKVHPVPDVPRKSS